MWGPVQPPHSPYLGITIFVTLPHKCIIKQIAQEMNMLTLHVTVYTHPFYLIT
jgi:hypothetical protein